MRTVFLRTPRCRSTKSTVTWTLIYAVALLIVGGTLNNYLVFDRQLKAPQQDVGVGSRADDRFSAAETRETPMRKQRVPLSDGHKVPLDRGRQDAMIRRERQLVEGRIGSNQRSSAGHPPSQQPPNSSQAPFGGNGSALDLSIAKRYPILTADGSFVPPRRVVHFDLKGGAMKAEFFERTFPLLATLGATSVLLEWEDMFPFTGALAAARNGLAYTPEQVSAILLSAKNAGLEVIPLVQTFGHLEYVLKLERFAHLRESQQFPQVICFGKKEAWDLVKNAIDQIARFHAKYGLPFFHIGADEAFTVGECAENRALLQREGGKQNLILWHIARTAEYVRQQYPGVRVLAWHDMFAHVGESHLRQYRLPELLEPVVWSYAEDLDHYLPHNTWTALRAFPYIWGASAFKGADGPARFYSNAPHYIQNHYAWIKQMNRNYKSFRQFRGIILTGWSRYDHFAVLCELFPIGFPSLAMNLRIMKESKELREFPELQATVGCAMKNNPIPFTGCNFPGAGVYDLVHQLRNMHIHLHSENGFLNKHEFGGWIGRTNQRFLFSSNWYLQKLSGEVNSEVKRLESALGRLRSEMSPIFMEDTVEEFIYEYFGEDLELLRGRMDAIRAIEPKRHFPLRPFAEFVPSQRGKNGTAPVARR